MGKVAEDGDYIVEGRYADALRNYNDKKHVLD